MLKHETGRKLLFELRSAFRDCETEMSRMAAKFNVPLSYYYILRTLEDDVGETQTQIALNASMTPSVASQVIQKMCKVDLLVREADFEDARIKRVQLTAKGLALRDDLNQACDTHLLKGFANITMKDMKTAITVLKLLQESLRD